MLPDILHPCVIGSSRWALFQNPLTFRERQQCLIRWTSPEKSEQKLVLFSNQFPSVLSLLHVHQLWSELMLLYMEPCKAQQDCVMVEEKEMDRSFLNIYSACFAPISWNKIQCTGCVKKSGSGYKTISQPLILLQWSAHCPNVEQVWLNCKQDKVTGLKRRALINEAGLRW